MSRFYPAILAIATLFFPLGLYADPASDEFFLQASPRAIESDPALMGRMTTLAETTYAENCATCHGADFKGGNAVPDLTDFDWLWGVTGNEGTTSEPVFEVMQTILYGIRDRACPDDVKSYGACPDSRYSEMPAYGGPEIAFSDQELDDLVEFVLMRSGQEYSEEAVARAAPNTALCTECHGAESYGYKPYGGPDLTDSVWLYGGSREQIRETLKNGRMGNCPPWTGKLDMVTIKALAVYIYRKSVGY